MTQRHMTNVADLTWTDVRSRIAGGAFAILPVGAGAKQHGFHLPMGTDGVQAAWLAARLAAKFDALVWPTLTYGIYPAFVAYDGSCSLSEDVFVAVVRELTLALLGYGAPVAILDTGISTRRPIDRAVAALPDPARVLHLAVYDGPAARALAGRLATRAHGGHADELETSRMLAIAPDAVLMARAEASPAAPPSPGPLQHADAAAPNYSRSGTVGDPAGATRAKGEALLAAMLADMADAVGGWLQAVAPNAPAR